MKQLFSRYLLLILLLSLPGNAMGLNLFLGEVDESRQLVNIPGGPETFSCGIYHIKGAIKKIESSQKFFFELYPRTRRGFVVELTGDIRKQFPANYRFDDIVKDKYPVIIEIEIMEPGQGKQAKGRVVKLIELGLRSEIGLNAVLKIIDNPF